jgi:hypothetical protein
MPRPLASTGRRFVIVAGLAVVVGCLLAERGSTAQATPQRTGAEAGVTANSQTFVDATGDNRCGSSDITTVRVSNDDAGSLEFQLVIPNRTDLADPDFISVYLDTDRSASTGCDFGGGFGADWGLASQGQTAPKLDRFSLHRVVPVGCQFEPPGTIPQGSYAGMFDGATSTLTLRLHKKDVGDPPSFRFEVLATVDPIGPETADTAGDGTPWVYEILVRAPAPPRDRTPPRVKALASAGVRGSVAKLRYTVFDDSKRTREEITVLRGRRVLATRRTKLGSRNVTSIYSQRWRVPTNISTRLRFCVRAWDAAGNRSAKSCAPLAIR